MNSQVLRSHSIVILMFSFYLIALSSVALAVKVDATMYSMRPQTADDIVSRPNSIDSFKAVASMGWGLWMGSEMVFLDGKKVLQPAKLNLVWQEVDGRFVPAVSLFDRSKQVVFDSFSEEDALRLALWVARSEISIPFSQPPQSHRARDLLKEHGYIAPTHECRHLEIFRDAHLVKSHMEDILTHPVLDTPALLQTMCYIDFSDGNQVSPESNLVVATDEDSEEIIAELHGLDNIAGTGASYTNADLHAQFSSDLASGKIIGRPHRYYWKHESDGNIDFHLVARFVQPDSLKDKTPKGLEARQHDAINLYRLASVFFTFAQHNKKGILHFIDEAFSRAESD